LATKLTNAETDWRIRLKDGEYSLSLAELGAWIMSGRVSKSDHVRPPTTRRWKLISNTVELERYFDERIRLQAQQRAAVEAPLRAAVKAREAARIASTKRAMYMLACVLAVLAVLSLFTRTDMGVAAAVALGAIGLIVYFIGFAINS
jgi:Flp pilus assembly protein TadB